MNGSKIALYLSAAAVFMTVVGFLYKINDGVTKIQTKVQTIDTQLQVAINNIEHLQNVAREIKVAGEKSGEGLKKEIAALAEKIDEVRTLGMVNYVYKLKLGEIKGFSDALTGGLSREIQGSASTTFVCSGTPTLCRPVISETTDSTPTSLEIKSPNKSLKGQN